MKVCIYGAGAIGGWIGAHLAQHGCSLSAVARGATLEALQQNGLVLLQGGQEMRTSLVARENPADLGVQDLVIVAVKAPALAHVAPLVAPLLGPKTVVLTAMNGVPWWFFDGLAGDCEGLTLQTVDPGGAIAAVLPTHHVLGCVVAGEAIKRRVEEQLVEGWGIRPQWVSSSPQAGGVINSYEHPQRLGSDRWAAIIGARQHALRLHPEHFAPIQMLSTALLMTLTRPHAQASVLAMARDNGERNHGRADRNACIGCLPRRLS